MPKVTDFQIFAAMPKTNQKYTTTNTVKIGKKVVDDIVFIIPEPVAGAGKQLHYVENGKPMIFKGTIETNAKPALPFVVKEVTDGGKSRRRKSRRVRRTIRRTRNNYFY